MYIYVCVNKLRQSDPNLYVWQIVYIILSSTLNVTILMNILHCIACSSIYNTGNIHQSNYFTTEETQYQSKLKNIQMKPFNLNTSLIGRKIHKLWPCGPFKSPCTDYVNELITIQHLVTCQPIRSLQVGPDLPNRPHVSVNL